MNRIFKPFVLVLMLVLGNVLPSMAQEKTPDFTVAKDGSGDFLTVQEAIYAVPDFRKNETVIFVKAGVYKEKLVIADSKTKVTLIGEDVDKVKITNDDYSKKHNRFGEEMGTTGSSSVFVFGDEFTAKNITFENSAGPVGQAVAIRVNSDKSYFENCKFLGFQDTLYVHGTHTRQHYKNCYVEGTVDFIFGWAQAVFEDCEIHAKQAETYITAASTEAGEPSGLTFINCKLTSDLPANSVYLGRPWREYAQTVFINCWMGAHIKTEGWHNWNKPHAEKTAFYAEYNSQGPGASKQRVPWSHQLTKAEAAKYTVEQLMSDKD